MKFDRQNKNMISSWWWTVDRMSLTAILLIICFGAIMVTTASPAIAERIGYDSFYFIRRQLIFLFISCWFMIGVSMLSPTTVRRLAVIAFIGGIFLLVGLLLFGNAINGAKRWMFIAGVSIQPSEFMKPLFIIVTAWMLSESKIKHDFKGVQISLVLYALLAFLLIMQPDFGMFIVVSAVWAGQMFIAGLSYSIIASIGGALFLVMILAYLFFPHFAYRIDNFINAESSGNYQVNKSLDAFHSGGLTGRGPGEGVVKQTLPDSHTDFIFAVVGEELGAIFCILLVVMYGFIVLRGLKSMLKEDDLFIVYSVAGLLIQFGIQAIINMSVALNLLPTKGMTLPFISYGGSSMLAIAMAMGMMLSLTKRRFGNTTKISKTTNFY